jgi:hypothetical protein
LREFAIAFKSGAYFFFGEGSAEKFSGLTVLKNIFKIGVSAQFGKYHLFDDFVVIGEENSCATIFNFGVIRDFVFSVVSVARGLTNFVDPVAFALAVHFKKIYSVLFHCCFFLSALKPCFVLSMSLL